MILFRQATQRFHVRLGEDSAHTGARLQAAGRNFLIQPESQREADSIRIHVFTEACNFIDERNLSRDKRCSRLARQLRRFVIRDQHRNAAHHQRMKNLFQRRDGFTRARAQKDPVRPVEIFHRASIGEEHGLASQQTLQCFFLQLFFNDGGRTNSHRSDDRQHLKPALRRCRQSQNNVLQPLRRIFGEKNHLGAPGQFFWIRRIDQAPRTNVAPDYFLQIFFEESDVALGNFHDARAIRMTAANRSAKIGKASRDDRSKIAGPIDPNLHILSSDRNFGIEPLPTIDNYRSNFQVSLIQSAAWDPALAVQPVNLW